MNSSEDILVRILDVQEAVFVLVLLVDGVEHRRLKKIVFLTMVYKIKN